MKDPLPNSADSRSQSMLAGTRKAGACTAASRTHLPVGGPGRAGAVRPRRESSWRRAGAERLALRGLHLRRAARRPAAPGPRGLRGLRLAWRSRGPASGPARPPARGRARGGGAAALPLANCSIQPSDGPPVRAASVVDEFDGRCTCGVRPPAAAAGTFAIAGCAPCGGRSDARAARCPSPVLRLRRPIAGFIAAACAWHAGAAPRDGDPHVRMKTRGALGRAIGGRRRRSQRRAVVDVALRLLLMCL